MPIYQAGNIVESHLLMQLQGREVMICPFFRVKATPDLPTRLRDEIRNFYWAAVRLAISNRVNCYGWKSREISTQGTGPFTTEIWATDNGGVISNLGHEGVSSIIVIDHDGGNDTKTGRMYLPGSGLGYINGFFDTSGIGRLDNVIAALNARFVKNGTSPWLNQVKKSWVPSQQFFLYSDVTGFRYRRFLGMQRRRRPDIGV